MENQPTINIATLGHVAHGKSTIVRSLSGITTGKFSAELKKNMTIKLGYANIKIYQCQCARPDNFHVRPSSHCNPEICCKCQQNLQLIKHVSFVDCPGHEFLMTTMLNGAAVMDASILVVAANEPSPQPQSEEHLAVASANPKPLIVVQNKIDLISQQQALNSYHRIKKFVNRYHREPYSVVPVSAVAGYNMDILAEMISKIPEPVRDPKAAPLMIVVRSFDINKPNTSIDDIRGGVAGGSLLRGSFTDGQIIEIRPGLINRDGGFQPLRTKIVSLYSEQNRLTTAYPGGLIAVGCNLDPVLTKSDRLVGHVIGLPGQLPEVYTTIVIRYNKIKRLINRDLPEKFNKGDNLKININSLGAMAKITGIKSDLLRLEISKPCCIEDNQIVSIQCKNSSDKWQLYGFGNFIAQKSKPIKMIA